MCTKLIIKVAKKDEWKKKKPLLHYFVAVS